MFPGRHGNGAVCDVQQVGPYIADVLARKGEKPSAAEIENDLIEAAEPLSRENMDLLDALYKKGWGGRRMAGCLGCIVNRSNC
jgi:hypothetical protein